MFGYNNYGGAYIPQAQQRPMTMPMTQQQMAQPQQPMVAPCPFQDVRFVNEKEANGFLVLPNQKVLLIDNENKKMWVKFADSMGTSTTETYHFERVEDIETGTETISQIDTLNFAMRKDLENCVTKDELISIRETIKELEKQVKISQILNDKPNSTPKGE